MKRTLEILLALTLAAPAFAATRISALVTVTNTPAAAETLVVNTDTRTWATNVATPASQVLIGADIGASTTNLFSAVAASPFAGAALQWVATNQVRLVANVDAALAVSLTGTWGEVALTTNVVTTLYPVRVPLTGEPSQPNATNVASLLVAGISSHATNEFSETATAFRGFVNQGQTQGITGAKVMTNLANVFHGTATNLVVAKATVDGTNQGVLFGNFTWLVDNSGRPALYEDSGGVIGSAASYDPADEDLLNAAIGDYRYGKLATANVWTGTNRFTQITNTVILGGTINGGTVSGTVGSLTNGTYRLATLVSSTFGGTLGDVAGGWWDTGYATDLSVTNLVTKGFNNLDGGINYPMLTHDSLANGANAAIDFGESSQIKLTAGPTAAFSLNGIANGGDGRVLRVLNATGQDMTIPNESGLEPTAANRILTPNAGDMLYQDLAVVELAYDSGASRWRVVGGTGEETGVYWDDSQVPGLAFKASSSPPGLDAFLGSGGILAYAFDNASVEQVYGSIQLPHRYKEGTEISPHVHWAGIATPASASNTNIVWGLEYSWASVDGTFAAPTTIYATNSFTGTAWTDRIADFANVDGTGQTISSVFIFRLFRAATSASDTYDRDASLLGFDLHHQVDSPGSREETVK